MTAWSIPRLLDEGWMWVAVGWSLLVAILAVRHFRHEAPPKPHPFFVRHKKTIRVAMDIFIVCSVSAMLLCVVRISLPGSSSLSGVAAPIKQIELQSAWITFSAGMMVMSAWGAALVGLLSVFQSNITRLKRIVLLALCLLPVVFAVASLSRAYSGLGWRAISQSILVGVPSWLVNGPAVLTGRPFFLVMWRVMRKLNLASGDYTEWR